MEKVLVYAETVRAARSFYKGTNKQRVGHRTYEQHGNGEKADLVLFKDESKLEKPVKNAKLKSGK